MLKRIDCHDDCVVYQRPDGLYIVRFIEDAFEPFVYPDFETDDLDTALQVMRRELPWPPESK